jgi:F-type H+-transporting ATPase subunit delta
MTNRTAAIRYARALLDVAVREAPGRSADRGSVTELLQRIEEQLAAFAALFTEYPSLQKVLLNPTVPVPQKRAAVAALTDRLGVLPIVAKLLAVLAERDRLVLVPELVVQYRERFLDYQHVVRAEVVTAVPLREDQERALQSALSHATGRTVRLSTQVDPAIIGGLVARIGSTVYDGSLTRQLEKMKVRLAERA